MDFKQYNNLRVSLENTIVLANKAGLSECSSELQEMCDVLEQQYITQVEEENEIKRQLDKGGTV